MTPWTTLAIMSMRSSRMMMRVRTGRWKFSVVTLKDVKQAIATKLIELAKAGERNPNIMCERVLEEILGPQGVARQGDPEAGPGDARAPTSPQ